MISCKRIFFLTVITLVTAIDQEGCNICGCKDCQILASSGSVEFIYQDRPLKLGCSQLQNIVQNPVAISRSFCLDELPRFVLEPCLCAYPNGDLILDTPPTASPTTIIGKVEEDGEAMRSFGSQSFTIFAEALASIVAIFFLLLQQ
jgi:hypothetical protein